MACNDECNDSNWEPDVSSADMQTKPKRTKVVELCRTRYTSYIICPINVASDVKNTGHTFGHVNVVPDFHHEYEKAFSSNKNLRSNKQEVQPNTRHGKGSECSSLRG
jgi:hypothetical protein